MGVCTKCWKAPITSRGLCLTCIERRSKGRRALEKIRLASGLCVECKGPLDSSGRRCCACAKALSSRKAKRSKKLREMGMCRDCGSRKAVPGYKTCGVCLYIRSLQSVRYRKVNAKLVSNTRRKYEESYRKSGRCKCSRFMVSPVDDGYKSCSVCRTRKSDPTSFNIAAFVVKPLEEDLFNAKAEQFLSKSMAGF